MDLIAHPERYHLVLSDDMDSFYSCRFLTKRTGVQIGGFYTFEKGLYISEDVLETDKKPVFVDVACVQDGTMAFDNHRSICRNHMAINPNIVTDRLSDDTYFQKYCGSTLMLVVALYGKEDGLTEQEKEFLIAMDSFHIGLYKNGGRFKDINLRWLDLLGLKEELLPIYEAHDGQYFEEVIKKHDLNEHISIGKDGRLHTYDDILPHDRFLLDMKVKKTFISKKELEQYPISDDKLFVAAETFKGDYVINTIV